MAKIIKIEMNIDKLSKKGVIVKISGCEIFLFHLAVVNSLKKIIDAKD